METESKTQENLEELISQRARKFLNYLNPSLPENMELEYEGFYRRGFFVTKKRYAVIENNKIIAKGLELVRRDWAPIAKNTQQAILMALLKNGDVDEAVKIIETTLKNIKTGKVDINNMIIHTQITKKLSEYKQIGPHIVAAEQLQKKGTEIRKGSIIRYIIVKGKGSISSRAVPIEEINGYTYDADYYIDNQLIPAVTRIMTSFGYTKESLTELSEKEKQTNLDAFF
ncbi:DNA polymerase domain-containing protein [Methanobrevibacter filiformis]|uniref:DNA-directed DNA polymerase n=1 Tax=Methanobrevibacter filiformis TaxID=55758 RepID=A0A166DAN5_9EURY|nr:DNA polymerase domain-containing protein [Methanobrevibacter filiformis]KZX15385.1 DNA polymerase II [Methanobrevibacter filiformis]